MKETAPEIRTPDDIRQELEDLVGDAEVAQNLVWQIIEDVVSSYKLAVGHALQDANLGLAHDGTMVANNLAKEINGTVEDYLCNHWGDD